MSQFWLWEQSQLRKFQEYFCDNLATMATQVREGGVKLLQELDLFGSNIQRLEGSLEQKD